MCCVCLAAIIDEDVIRYERIKKKAYVRITTNLGSLNLELHSDIVSTVERVFYCGYLSKLTELFGQV